MLYILSLILKMIYCYHFNQKGIYHYTYYICTMGGVLEHLRWPLSRRQPYGPCVPLNMRRIDLPIMQLETAKEILGEVFDTSSSEVDEMIRLRLAERGGGL
jgi:hypothetical protein